jgi:protein-disulfide isomerase
MNDMPWRIKHVSTASNDILRAGSTVRVVVQFIGVSAVLSALAYAHAATPAALASAAAPVSTLPAPIQALAARGILVGKSFSAEAGLTGWVVTREGRNGIIPVSTMKPETLRTLTANRALMDAFGSNGTPAIVWKDSHGVVQAKSGMPPLSELSAMTGLPEQPETDRDLDRFR